MKNIFLIILLSFSVSEFAGAKEKVQVVELAVTEKGFEPNSINVKPDQSVTLKVTRKTDSTCAKKIQVPSKKLTKELPLNKSVSIDLGKLKKGEIRFGCGMDMMLGGQIHVR